MARPKADFPPAGAILALADAQGRLAVRVTPGARVEAMEITAAGLAIRTRAKPKDGEANDAVIALVAAALGCAPSRIDLLRGATSREKLLRIASSQN